MQQSLSTVQPTSTEEKRTRTDTTAQSEKWMTVMKKGRKKSEKVEKMVKSKLPPTKGEVLWKRKPRQDAVIVVSKINGGEYADIIRKAKSLVFLQEFGLQVAKTHYTRKGEMLLELKGLPQKDSDVVDFTDCLHQTFTAEADIKTKQHTRYREVCKYRDRTGHGRH